MPHTPQSDDGSPAARPPEGLAPSPALVESFRAAMRGFATSLAIVTTRDGAGLPQGIAASAIISLSMEPPSLLIAINRASSIHPALGRRRQFCVNVLRDDQRDLVAAFCRSDLRSLRFRDGDWVLASGELPHLRSAQSVVFCDVERSIDHATHRLLIGRVIRVHRDKHCLPLIWIDGAPASIRLPGDERKGAAGKKNR